MVYLCRGQCWVIVTRSARRHLWGMCRGHLWCISAAVSVGSRCVVARFARRHLWGICAAVTYGVFLRRLVLGHSAWLLASLVGTYGVFVPRSLMVYVCGGQCWVTLRGCSLRS